jgi:hypothetical protein
MIEQSVDGLRSDDISSAAAMSTCRRLRKKFAKQSVARRTDHLSNKQGRCHDFT